MYRKTNSKHPYLGNFYLPFEGKFCQDNRWVLLTELISWELAEEFYRNRFGYLPETVLADQFYGTRDNRHFLKKLGVCFGGKMLEHPTKRDRSKSTEAKTT